MDDKTTPVIPTQPETPETPQDAYSYKDVHDSTTREIVENKETPKVEEKPIEKEVKPEIKVDEGEDLEAVGKRIAQTTAEETAKRFLEEQKAQAQPQEKDEYDTFVEKYRKEHGTTPEWKIMATFLKEQAKKELQDEQTQKEEKVKEDQELAQKNQEEERNRINAFVDDELQELYNSGRLTKIVDPNNPNDPGNIERKALFARWAEVNMERRANNLPEIISATRIYDFYYKRPNAQPAGADAPVSGSQSSGIPPAGEGEIDYVKDIRGKSWNFFKRG